MSKKELKRLIRHCWVHSGYPDCGYSQMDTRMKKVYCKVIGASYDERQEITFGAK